jgi:hypothetical protein
MALRHCYECGNNVSDKAPACPKCGAPQGASLSAGMQGTLTVQAPQKRKTHPITWVILILLVSLAYYYSRQVSLPSLPITVQFRPALLGPGLVLMFENTSDSPITFVARLNRPATNITRSLELYAPAHRTVSIGSRDGWLGEHGDQITLKNNNSQTWNGSIP